MTGQMSTFYVFTFYVFTFCAFTFYVFTFLNSGYLTFDSSQLNKHWDCLTVAAVIPYSFFPKCTACPGTHFPSHKGLQV